MRTRGRGLSCFGALLLAAALQSSSAVALQQAPPARSVTTGWLGWWATDVQVEALAESEAVDEVSAFYWTFESPERPLCTYDAGDYDKDGQWGDCIEATATPWTNLKFNRQRDVMRSAGITVLGTLHHLSSSSAPGGGGFDDTFINYIASSPGEFADKITEYAAKAGLDGVDLNLFVSRSFDDTWIYPIEDAEKWSNGAQVWQTFIQLLSKRLHASGLLLSVSVPVAKNVTASDGSTIPSGGFPVYSWSEIAPLVDRLKLVMDPYSYSTPGPISPANWAEQVAKSAINELGDDQAGKVWLGTPQYGRNWPMKTDVGYAVNDGCPSDWAPTDKPFSRIVSPLSGPALALRNGVEPIWDASAGEWTFTYWESTTGRAKGQPVECLIQRQVWFSSTRSAVGRAHLATSFGFAGVAAWELGVVDGDFFPSMKTYAVEASLPKIALRAPSQSVGGRPVTLSAQFQHSGLVLNGRPTTLWWSATRAGKRTSIASKLTGADGKVTFRARPKVSGFWWITASTQHGLTWTAGPTRVALRK